MDYQPFRELMIPLSGVVQMSLLQRDDKKIFLIGDMHTPTFCRHKGFTPLCSILEEYLQTRTKDEPVDFMLEKPNEEEFIPPSFEETRAICGKRVNTGEAIIGLVRHMVHQYIPPVRSPLFQYIQSENNLLPLPQKTVVQLPNARVHWLDPKIVDPITREDRLIYFLWVNSKMSDSKYDSDFTPLHTPLYITRTIINDLLEIDPEDIPWALREQHVIQSYNKDPTHFRSLVFDTIPDRELFLQSSESSKIAFFEKVYHKLRGSKHFKKCYSGNRIMEWKILREAFIEMWRDYSKIDHTIDFFYFCVQRFLMDFFTCCRILKEEGRWYKNMVIYAGSFHTENIERMLLSMDFQNVPLPPIHYDPECSGKSRQRKKRKTRRHKDVK
jgi:hypothetical protein